MFILYFTSENVEKTLFTWDIFFIVLDVYFLLETLLAHSVMIWKIWKLGSIHQISSRTRYEEKIQTNETNWKKDSSWNFEMNSNLIFFLSQ